MNDVWTGSAGGHFENQELNDARACIFREMEEELGLLPNDIDRMTLRYITLRKTNEEIRQNYYFFAELKDNIDDNLCSNEGVSKWFLIEEIDTLEMPLTAKFVTQHYSKIGHLTNNIYVGIATNDNVIFNDLSDT